MSDIYITGDERGSPYIHTWWPLPDIQYDNFTLGILTSAKLQTQKCEHRHCGWV